MEICFAASAAYIAEAGSLLAISARAQAEGRSSTAETAAVRHVSEAAVPAGGHLKKTTPARVLPWTGLHCQMVASMLAVHIRLSLEVKCPAFWTLSLLAAHPHLVNAEVAMPVATMKADHAHSQKSEKTVDCLYAAPFLQVKVAHAQVGEVLRCPVASGDTGTGVRPLCLTGNLTGARKLVAMVVASLAKMHLKAS